MVLREQRFHDRIRSGRSFPIHGDCSTWKGTCWNGARIGSGLLPGGIQTDPTGPPSSLSGRKVTRGGAFDNTQQSCRSAERSLFNAGPFDTDTDLGFRVVLVPGPQ